MIKVDQVIKDNINLVKFALTGFGERRDSIKQELYSEGLIGLWDAARTWDHNKSGFTNYALLHIRHRMQNHLRKEDRWANELIGFNKIGEEIRSPAPSAEDFMLRYELNMKIRRACGKLNEREQDVLTNRMLVKHPETLKELAKKWNTSYESIRRDERRLKKLIKENYKDGDGNDGIV